MKNGASILVVEDAGIIAQAMKSILEEKGYVVLTAHDAQAASLLLDNANNCFDLIITDLDLGAGPDGWDVAFKARGTNANIPVIYLTGSPIGEWLMDAPKSLIMQKPVTAESVTKAVDMFAERIAGHHKSCLSNSIESLQFRLNHEKDFNRALALETKEEAKRQALRPT